MRNIAGGLLFALSMSSAALAEPDQIKPSYGHFYNRPGASVDEVGLALNQCSQIAKGARRSPVAAVGIGPVGLAAGLLTAGILSGLTQGAKIRDNVQHCMVIQGWRLFAMAKSEGAAWSKLTDEQRQARLVNMSSADVPEGGKLYRIWQNDYAEPRLWQK